MVGTVLTIVVGFIVAAVAGLWLFGERGQPMRRSTWRLIREGGWRSVFNGDFWHAYVYARWTNQYIGWSVNKRFPKLGPPVEGRHLWADAYHGKVVPQTLARALVTVQEDIPLRDLEQIVPYDMARNLVLQGPPDVVAYECGCRAAREHPCEPTQVCMVVGQPFADFVLDHNPRSSRRLTQAEALTLLREEYERGHIHVAYFKDVMLDRFYAICNCCGCCCVGLQAMRDHGVPMVATSGYVAQVDTSRCEACETCAKACPFDAITVGQNANAHATVDWEACMGCGVCEGQCPNGAMALVLDPRKGTPLDVRALPSWC